MATATNVRRSHGGGPPVGRHVESITLAYATDDTTIEADVEISGTILGCFLVIPALDGSQATLSFEDEDDDEYYSSGLKDESQTHYLTPGFTCTATLTIKIVTATAQTADRVFKVKLLYA